MKSRYVFVFVILICLLLLPKLAVIAQDCSHYEDTMQLFSKVPLPENTKHCIASGDFYYVAGYTYLSVYDVDNPATPNLINSYSLYARPEDLICTGTHLFLALGESGIISYDLSTPFEPVQIDSLNLGANIISLAHSTDKIIAINTDGLLYVINSSDPGNLATIAQLQVLDSSVDVATLDSYVLVTGPDGIAIVNLEIPDEPQLVTLFNDRYPGQDPDKPPPKFDTITTSDGIAVVSALVWMDIESYPLSDCCHQKHLLKLDLTNPIDPFYSGKLLMNVTNLSLIDNNILAAGRCGLSVINLDSFITLANIYHGVLYDASWIENYILAVGGANYDHYIHVYDATNPVTVMPLVTYGDHLRHHGGSACYDLCTYDFSYEAEYFKEYFIFDLSDFQNPVSRYQGILSDPDYCPDISIRSVTSDYMCLAMTTEYYLVCFELFNLSNTPVETRYLPYYGYYDNVQIVDDIAWNYRVDHLLGIDISDFSNFRIVSDIEVPYGGKFRVSSGKAFIFCDEGIYILDICDPTSPKVCGYVGFPEQYYSTEVIEVDDDLAYIGTHNCLYVLDLTNPDKPTIIGTLPTEYTIRSLCINDDLACLYLYKSWSEHAFQIISLQDPSNPVALSPITNVYLGTMKPLIIDDILYWARYNGLEVYDISDPTAPHLLGVTKVNSSASKLSYDADGAIIVPSSAFPYACPEQLPVFFVNYSANVIGNEINISWDVEAELGEFHIEGQYLGNTWTVQINSDSPGSYYINDSFPQDYFGGYVTYYIYYEIDGRWILIRQEQFEQSREYDNVELISSAPNPFNPQISISFTVDQPQNVRISVYDVKGRCVAVLTDRVYLTGLHLVEWDGHNAVGREVSSGAYIVRMETQNRVDSQKIILVR